MQRLLEHLHDDFDDDGHKYTALVPSVVANKWQDRLPRFDVRAANQKWYGFSEQISLAWQLHKLKPDLVHFTMPQQPLVWTGPAVTTIHDMTLIDFESIGNKNPHIYRFKKWVFTKMVAVVMARAKAVIVPTNFVKLALENHYPKTDKNTIVVTHEAGEIPDVEPESISELENKKFLFFVGNAFPYKNVGLIIEAFAKIKFDFPDIHLALAGKKDEFYRDLENEAKSKGIEDIHFLGFIKDSEKRWAFQNAEAFVTASLSEGFCIPLLEAMIEGAPVIAANASCLPEVAGDAAVYFDPKSAEDLATKLTKLLNDPEQKTKLTELGHKRVAKFSWSKMTRETRDIYNKIISK